MRISRRFIGFAGAMLLVAIGAFAANATKGTLHLYETVSVRFGESETPMSAPGSFFGCSPAAPLRRFRSIVNDANTRPSKRP